MPEPSSGSRTRHAGFAAILMTVDSMRCTAAYLFNLVQNHPFFDGNKRVGAMAAVIFLALTGHEFGVPPGVLYDFVSALARGEQTKAHAAVFLREHSTRA